MFDYKLYLYVFKMYLKTEKNICVVFFYYSESTIIMKKVEKNQFQ